LRDGVVMPLSEPLPDTGQTETLPDGQTETQPNEETSDEVSADEESADAPLVTPATDPDPEIQQSLDILNGARRRTARKVPRVAPQKEMPRKACVWCLRAGREDGGYVLRFCLTASLLPMGVADY
jgi:hypothetical protein